MKRRKACSNEIAAKYINFDVLCGTSVQCERLFSVAKNILTDTKISTSPAVFQAILLLNVNRTEWDAYTVGRAIGRSTGEKFSVGSDGGSVGGKEAADDPDLFSKDDESDFLCIRLLAVVVVKHHSSSSLQNGLSTWYC
jgi:hypothetical protein